jgi:hypothetical protein
MNKKMTRGRVKVGHDGLFSRFGKAGSPGKRVHSILPAYVYGQASVTYGSLSYDPGALEAIRSVREGISIDGRPFGNFATNVLVCYKFSHNARASP